jgi:hypothetical protein
MKHMTLLTPGARRSLMTLRLLPEQRRHCSPSVVSAGAFEMRSELRLIVRVGLHSEPIERHMASSRPVVFRLTPTVRAVSRR